MRLVLIVHRFLPHFSSGTEVLTLELAQGLQASGHEVHVLTVEPATPEVVRRCGDWYAAPYKDLSVYRLNCAGG
jgi:hypothetical protein